MLGLSWADVAADFDVIVWPENAAAVDVFCFLSTQWRCNEAGPCGLDYNVFPLALRTCGIPRKQHSEIIEQVRVMESAALQTIHSN